EAPAELPIEPPTGPAAGKQGPSEPDEALRQEIEAVAGIESPATPLSVDPVEPALASTTSATGESTAGREASADLATAARELRDLAAASPLRNSEARQALIESHHPPRLATSETALVPPGLRGALRARLGRLREALSDYEGALAEYSRAVGLGLEDCEVWRGLGRMRVRAGEFEGAEGALLAALEHGYCNAQVYAELGELYLLTRQRELAVIALERAAELTPGAVRVQGLLARARFELDPTANSAPDQLWPLWPAPPDSDWRPRFEAALRSSQASLPPELQGPAARAAIELRSPKGIRIALGVLGGLVMLLLLARLLRKQGDLTISIEYPSELRGTFSVRLATQAGGVKRSGRGARSAALRGATSTATEHFLVGRETRFRRLPPRWYFVSVEGVIQNPENQEILTEPFEEKKVQVRGRITSRLEFDFRPDECPVDVKISWENKPARDAGVAVRGQRQAVRYARGGAARIELKRGSHTLVVGSGDRVAEHPIDIRSFAPIAVEIDLSSGQGIVFKGCPPAVEPYLQGDVTAAARALEREGQSEKSHLLLARMYRDQGQAARAAKHFESAGCPLEAAQLRAEQSDPRRAADLFAEGGDSLRAAELYREAGELVLAGEAYEAARDLEKAIGCYREAGDVTRWIDALERRGETFEAAQVALEHGDRTRTVRLLQLVSPDDPHYPEACAILSDAFELEGHTEMAAQKLEEHIVTSGPDGSSPDRQSHLAELYESCGGFAQAVEVLEKLRQREPTYPNVATRIEVLRKKISERDLADSIARSSVGRASGSSAPTTWLCETRYEILEEIGRGGMGVVFKARDQRLGRVVALKRLPDNLQDHPKAIQLFLREAQASAQLTHPNIVTVFDADQTEGTFFITMELLKGYPLNVILKKKRRLPVHHAARLLVQAAAGLHFAHEQRIVHRDIKPANLFFTHDKILKIMDFGLAKMIEEVRRAATVIGGTPYYMAPEQSAGDVVDYRADVYALGVTLYELVTGSVPFSEGDVTYHHRHTPVPDPRTRVPDLPAELVELIMHMLAKQVEARCASVAEVGERLQPFTKG
ncbi:MAG: protein kinase, partial [Myxococcota bacterium]